MNAQKAIVQVQDYRNILEQLAQTSLRSVLGEVELDDLLSQREKLNSRTQTILDVHTEPWGIKVTKVEVKQVDLPQDMQRAIARQAEAERERRAKIINADAEYQASEKLSEAASILAKEPITITLRYLQTLAQIGTEKNTTIVFPIPIELLSALLTKGAAHAAPGCETK
jgi:regulator of protease activity HflC (stomatin/prohibitin superfamily)